MKNTDTRRQLVQKAFKDLRTHGFVARMNFMCCASCAGSQLMAEPRLADKAYCYFHQQDGEVFDRRAGGDGIRGKLHLRFGKLSKEDGTELEMKLIGQAILTALRAQGLAATWSGDPKECVMVLV